MSKLKEKIKILSQAILPDIIEIRRHLHAHPELSFEEYNTAKYVAETLKAMGITPQEGVANTGLTAIIRGKDPSSSFYALRADMDALPITEANEVPYVSQNKGVMHACGHDAHTASLLGAARILHETKDEWSGTIKLIFQPGEEKAPGGALQMIREGVLKDPTPRGIIGQHVMPQLDAGKVGLKSGKYMASCDEIYLTVKGKGGHGAMPELTIDPILISAHIITALQQVISRRASPKTPTVLTIGKIIGEGATNVIPNEVKMEGTFRAFDEAWREEAHGLIKQVATGIAQSMGAKCEAIVVKGYPYVKNDLALTEQVRELAVDFLGEENVVDLDLWMGGEDFAYYSHEIPGCFYRFGVRNEAKNIISPVHTPTFDIDEKALETGMGLMAWLAVSVR